MPEIDKVKSAAVLSLPEPMIVDGCRLDAMVMGPAGEMMRPHLVVIITPAGVDWPFFSYKLPDSVDAQFRALADTMRDVLGGGE